MNTTRSKKRLTPILITTTPNKKILSPATIFAQELENQRQNRKKSELYHTVYNNKMIRETVQKIFNPHHLTEKSKRIRSKNSKSKGGKTRRCRNNK